MPRPHKYRRVCTLPQDAGFLPVDGEDKSPVCLCVDEYEAIRLMDLEGLTQEQCALQMEVSRSSVAAIYDLARRKLAVALVEKRPLSVSGGHYRLCGGHDTACPRWKGCPRSPAQIPPQGGSTMKIAVTYENGQVFQHFGHTSAFKLYDVEGGAVIASAVADTQGSGHGALAGFLAQAGVDTLICGGIGPGAQEALREAGITLYAGVTGDADQAVADLLADRLDYDPRGGHCDHHGEHHHGHHACGGHHHGPDHPCHHGPGHPHPHGPGHPCHHGPEHPHPHGPGHPRPEEP